MKTGGPHRATALAGIVFLLAAGVLTAGMVGCGRKGPPVLPGLAAPATISDLQATVVQGRVTLAWSMPATAAEDPWPEGFSIYRADPGPADCATCPLLFSKIGDLLAAPRERPAAGAPWRFSWQDRPVPGVRHVYKVAAYGRGRETVDSNAVDVRP